MINGNINSVTYMTRFVLKSMKNKSTKSAVINVGSATAAVVKSNGRFNLNQYQVYQATKAYQYALTNLLRTEYISNVDFINDLPATFLVNQKNLEDLEMRVSPESHVEQVLRSLGRVSETNGSLRHTWLVYLMKNFYLPKRMMLP